MKKSYLLPFLLITLVLVGCRTSFRITVQKPAVINLPTGVKKIIVVNNTIQKQDFKNVADGILTGEQINGDKRAADVFPDGLMRSLTNGGYTSMRVNAITLKKNSNIDYAVLDSLFSANDAQAVIVLDKFDSDSPIGGTVLNDAIGSTQSRLIGRATMSVYCQKNRLSMENVLVTSYFNIPTSGSLNPLALIQDVVNKKKWYGSLGRATGGQAGTYFYSPWVWVNRQFYNKGSLGLRRAKKMIYHGNWDIAEKKLNYVLEGARNNKVRGRASYNLALVYEGQGRLEDAIKMAEKSALMYNCKSAPSYLQVLKRRRNDVQIMQWQQQH